MQNELDAATRALFNTAYRTGRDLGRKFEASDMTPSLRQAARAYAASYQGDLAWGIEMRDRVIGGLGAFLTDGQAKGMLNILMADARRAMAQRAPKAAEAPESASAPRRETPIGTFTVVGIDAEHITIRLQRPTDKVKLAEGVVYAKYLAGADNDVDFAYFATVVKGQIRARGFERQVAALKVVLGADNGSLGKMGLAYALASSNCWRCGRTLTVPASIHSGMGPDCAAKVGAEYSEPEAPAAPEASEATAEQPAPAPQATRNTADVVDQIYRDENRAARAAYEALVREEGESNQSWFNRRYEALMGHTH